MSESNLIIHLTHVSRGGKAPLNQGNYREKINNIVEVRIISNSVLSKILIHLNLTIVLFLFWEKWQILLRD